MCMPGISEHALRGYTAAQLEQTLTDYQAMGGAAFCTPIMAEHAAAGELAEGEIEISLGCISRENARCMHTFALISCATENILRYCSEYME